MRWVDGDELLRRFFAGQNTVLIFNPGPAQTTDRNPDRLKTAEPHAEDRLHKLASGKKTGPGPGDGTRWNHDQD